MFKKLLKIISLLLLISVFGFIGFTFYFADLGPGENWFTRNFIAFAYFFISGGICSLISYPGKKIPFLMLWMVYLAAFLNLPGALFRSESSLIEFAVMITVPGSAVFLATTLTRVLRQRH